MDAAKSVGASFASAPPPSYALNVTVINGAAGSVTANGIACPGDCTETYTQGTVVVLTATPVSGGTFLGWTGSCTGTGVCTLTMDGAKAVSASFASPPIPTYVLTVTVTNGAAGSVTGTGISCPGDCNETLNQGTVVALTATPVSGGTFLGWTGACTGTGACSVTMNAAKTVGASFASPIPTYVLSVSAHGGSPLTVASAPGTVAGPGINCTFVCTATFNQGTVVTLTATPGTGAAFLGWSGACTGMGPCSVTMNAAASVTATFGYTLTIVKSGAGDGTVTSAPAGVNCGTTCIGAFTSGTMVTLTATANNRSLFAGWGGACTGTGTCTVNTNAAKSVTAAFTNGANVATSGYDFDGDGISDVLWRNSTTGAVAIWFMKDNSMTGTYVTTVPLNWEIVATGDMNGDNKSDILWRDSITGEVFIWLMNGATISSAASLGTVPLNWKVSGLDDLDGDSNADIIWRDTTTGEAAIWYMRGTTRLGVLSLRIISLDLDIVGTGDTTFDGKADIILRSKTNGEIWIYKMDATGYTKVSLGPVPLAWKVVGIADLDGDLQADIVWRNSDTGDLSVWYLRNGAISTTRILGTVSSDWVIKGLGNYDSDWRSDILWLHVPTGTVYVWKSRGLGTFEGAYVSAVTSDWNVVGP
jgi:co-chaperonin GroES (HSP10)